MTIPQKIDLDESSDLSLKCLRWSTRIECARLNDTDPQIDGNFDVFKTSL